MDEMGDIVKTAIMTKLICYIVRLKWPGVSVLTVITVVAVLPAIAEIVTIAAFIALLYKMVIIDIKIIMV